jgi:hypothetical protein
LRGSAEPRSAIPRHATSSSSATAVISLPAAAYHQHHATRPLTTPSTTTGEEPQKPSDPRTEGGASRRRVAMPRSPRFAGGNRGGRGTPPRVAVAMGLRRAGLRPRETPGSSHLHRKTRIRADAGAACSVRLPEIARASIRSSDSPPNGRIGSASFLARCALTGSVPIHWVDRVTQSPRFEGREVER